MVFVPGTAAVTPAMHESFARADVVLFDGTLFTDDEMIRTQTGQKTGRRMGHMQIDGDSGFVLCREKDHLDTGIVLFDDVEQLRSRSLRHAEIQDTYVRAKRSKFG